MSRYVIESDTLTPGIGKFDEKMDARIQSIMGYEATDAQNFMRTHAPWNDQTGNARQGLFAKSGKGEAQGPGRSVTTGRFTKGTSGSYYIVIYHTMPYGIWLEVKHEGKLAIIDPTLNEYGPRVMKDLNGLLRGMS